MELAKITGRGQITIPRQIRAELGVGNGDTVVFIADRGRVIMQSERCLERSAKLSASGGEAVPMNRTEAVRQIEAFRSRCEPVTIQEILAWRDEGRA
jgi:AbrB family looped-hinge helix DNA binding protein